VCTPQGKRYYVPKEGLPDRKAFIGSYANDLAIMGPALPQARDEYEARSRENNVAGLVSKVIAATRVWVW
jgi:hypothetical protein